MKIAIGNIFSGFGLLIATIFGIFAQVIAYFLNRVFPSAELQTCIIILTFASIFLFCAHTNHVIHIIRVINKMAKMIGFLSTGFGFPISILVVHHMSGMDVEMRSNLLI